jgi:transcriptional regulator NrdR family protein
MAEVALAKPSTDREPPKGIFCPMCQRLRARVLYTRPLCGGKTRRCRVCTECGFRFYTVEVHNARG